MDIICLLLMDISLSAEGSWPPLLSEHEQSVSQIIALASSWAQLNQHKYPSRKGVKKAGLWHL